MFQKTDEGEERNLEKVMWMGGAGRFRWKRVGRVLVRLAYSLSWLAALGIDVPLIRRYFPASGFRLSSDLTCFRDNGAGLAGIWQWQRKVRRKPAPTNTHLHFCFWPRRYLGSSPSMILLCGAYSPS